MAWTRHVVVVVPKHRQAEKPDCGRAGVPVFLSLPSASQARLDSIKPPFIAQDLHHALHVVSQDVQRHFGADVLQGPYLRGEAATCPLFVCPAFLRDRLLYLASHLLNRRRPLLTALLQEPLGKRGDGHHPTRSASSEIHRVTIASMSGRLRSDGISFAVPI
jgi:hypothetical protein